MSPLSKNHSFEGKHFSNRKLANYKYIARFKSYDVYRSVCMRTIVVIMIMATFIITLKNVDIVISI